MKKKKNSVVLTAEKRSKHMIPWTKLCCKILSNPLAECISYENCEQPSIQKKFVNHLDKNSQHEQKLI